MAHLPQPPARCPKPSPSRLVYADTTLVMPDDMSVPSPAVLGHLGRGYAELRMYGARKFIATIVHMSRSYLDPSEAAQHLPEGVRPDLDDPGERVVELADGEEYAADDQRQGRHHKRVRPVALKPE